MVSIENFIRKENPRASERIMHSIRAQIQILKEHPNIGRIGKRKATRELVISKTNYVAVYEIYKGDIVVLRILHGAQQWP